MKRNYFFLSLVGLLLTFVSKAQLAGTYSVPASYVTISAAVNALNSQSISAAVTILVDAGHIEIVPAGGLTLTASGTAAAPIVFQKNGTGANPLLTAYTTGTSTPGSAMQDGVWRFEGTDYITIDGIDILDPNIANPATMEFGYGFFKAGATDGCQNNTIKNCVITLNLINNDAGAGPAADGSRGIDVVNALTGAHTSAVAITSALGANSDNKFYSNTIQNCNVGIALMGFADVSPFTNADQNNDVGGNSITTGNTILNFGGGTAANPAAGIRTQAQYNINVSYNTINNNNGAGLPNASTLRGIFLNTATSSAATVNNNTITINSGTTTSQVSAIENASGSTAANNAITISNNLIANGTSSTTTGIYYGIYNTASSASLIISNNTFTNNSSNATTGASYLIRSTGLVTSAIDVSNNNLSHALTGPALTSAALYNIYVSGTGTTTNVYYNNNNFLAYTYSVTGTGALYFLYSDRDAVNMSITGNNISNLTLNHSGIEYMLYNFASVSSSLTVATNTISNISRTGNAGTTYGYYGSSTGMPSTQTFSNNLITNITAPFSGTGAFYGIYNTLGGTTPYPLKTVFSNTVSNINVAASGTFYGIYTTNAGSGPGTTGSSVYNNLIDNINTYGTIYGLYNGGSNSTGYMNNVYTNTVSNVTSNGISSIIYASYIGSSGAGINFFKNKIYNITINGSTGTAHGIYATTSPTSNVYNNLIGNIYAPLSGGANRANGIFAAFGTNLNFYYNTVYIDGTSSGTNFGTNAIYTSTSVTSVTLRNNIFVNLSTPTGTGTAVAYRRNGVSLTNYNTASNDNLFYAGTPSASNLIFSDGTNNYQSFASFVSAVSPRETSSFTENPTFQSTAGSNPNFLNINTTAPTQIESSGNPITGITDDYAGNLRNASTPDIGAWEGNYTAQTADITAPTFLADGFTTSACNLTARTYTINITDASGVATGTLDPRVYYSVNGGPYTSVAGTMTSGTALNGVWTFNLTYAGSIGDVISYFVVAEDVASPANVGALPGGGFAGTSVNNVTSNPTNPFTYTLNATLNGTYTIGATGTFTTLTQAANAYNNACLTGPVTYMLLDPSYSSNETFPIVFMNNPDASSTNSLLVMPSAGNNATIVTIPQTPTATTVKFLSARHITFDGVNAGGSALTVQNTHTTTSAALWLASTSGGPGNNNITLKNLNVVGSNTLTGRYGILASQDAVNPTTISGMDNDFITLQSNTITNVYYGLYAAGTSAANAGGMNNWMISSNTFGPAVLGSGNIAYRAIHILNAPGVMINGNTIRNIFSTSSASGIYLISGINGASVSQNTITNIFSSTASSAVTTILSGIYMGTSISSSTVNNNVIHTVQNTNATGYGARGIQINVGANSGNMVYNNMISDIKGNGRNTSNLWPIGIALEGSSGGVNIDFNTVHLNSSVAGVATATGSAAMYINTIGSNNNVRNNILVNTYDNTSITNDMAYSVYSSAATGGNLSVMDYNDYYAGGTGNMPMLGYVGSANRPNLSAIQTGFGGNLNSISVLPVFTATNDLHIQQVAANSALDNFGTTITGITIDIDNQTRNVTTPDMGADEFSTPTCTSAVGGTITPATYILCNGESLSITSTSVSAGSTTVYQWMSSATPGGPYTNVSGGAGANSPSYVSAPLSTGTLYYILEVTCTAASLTAVSNEATVVINPVPTASASANQTICAEQTLTLTGASDIGTSFNWTGPNSFTSAVQNPTITNVPANGSGNYTLMVSTPNCSATAFTSITVNSTSLNILAPLSICVGNSATLTAAGNGTTYLWSNGATTSSIAVSPTATTVYSVAATGTSNCTANQSFTLSVLNPTIIGTGAMACGNPSGTATLTANGFAPVYWYASPTSTLTIATGSTYVPAAVSTNTTFYAEAATSNTTSLFLSLAGGNGSSGNMFDIVAQTNIEVNGFDIHLSNTITNTIEIWYRPGTWVGFNTSNAGWTMAGTTTVTGMGTGNLTQVPLTFTVPIPGGQTYGFYVTTNGGGSVAYTNGTAIGNVWASNSDLQLLEGNGGGYFSVTFSPRAFNGQVKYSTPGCTSPRVPVTLTVNPVPTVSLTATQSIVCVNSSTVALTGSPSGGMYSGTNVSQGAFTPGAVAGTFSPVYSYTDAATGCSNSASVSIVVDNCTGVNSKAVSASLSVYPNPNNGEFVIELGNSEAKTIELSDLTGRVILSESTTKDKISVNIRALTNGVYFVKIKGADSTDIIKVVKQ